MNVDLFFLFDILTYTAVTKAVSRPSLICLYNKYISAHSLPTFYLSSDSTASPANYNEDVYSVSTTIVYVCVCVYTLYIYQGEIAAQHKRLISSLLVLHKSLGSV